MARSNKTYLLIPFTTKILYVALFVYAAISKFLDFNTFKVQLGQSPILTAHADTIAYVVPSSELLIALLLVFPRFSMVALYASLSVMTMFTTYIMLILNSSEYIPCSCGGILENMGWVDHLAFNLIFIVLAIVSILTLEKQKTLKTYMKFHCAVETGESENLK